MCTLPCPPFLPFRSLLFLLVSIIGVTPIPSTDRPLWLGEREREREASNWNKISRAKLFLRIHRSIWETQWGTVYRFALKLRAPKIRISDEAGSNARENSRSILAVGKSFDYSSRPRVVASCSGKIHQYFFLQATVYQYLWLSICSIENEYDLRKTRIISRIDVSFIDISNIKILFIFCTKEKGKISIKNEKKYKRTKVASDNISKRKAKFTIQLKRLNHRLKNIVRSPRSTAFQRLTIKPGLLSSFLKILLEQSRFSYCRKPQLRITGQKGCIRLSNAGRSRNFATRLR